MELFSFNKRKENIKRPELQELFEQASQKINTAVKVLMYSAIVGFGMTKNLQAQEMPERGKDFELKNPPIEWEANVPEQDREKIEKIVESQREWLVNYMKSPKFEERMTKEYLRTEDFKKEATDSKGILDYEDFNNNPKFITFKYDETGDTVAIVNNFNKVVEYKKDGYTMPAEEFEKIVTEKNVLEKLLPDPDTSHMTTVDKSIIKESIHMRLWRVDQGKTVIVDSIPDTDEVKEIIGNFDNGTKDINIVSDFEEKDETTPIHEYTHRSTNGDGKISLGSTFLLQDRARSGSYYLDDQTEIHARINELRFLLDQEKINNPSLENFTEKTYEEMLRNERIANNPAIKQLLQTLDKEDLIWFMNNLASLPISTTSFEDKA